MYFDGFFTDLTVQSFFNVHPFMEDFPKLTQIFTFRLPLLSYLKRNIYGFNTNVRVRWLRKNPKIYATMTLKKNQSPYMQPVPSVLPVYRATTHRWLRDAPSAAEASELDATQQAQGAGFPRATNGKPTSSPGVWKPRVHMGVSKNSGTPKWMVYNGKPY